MNIKNSVSKTLCNWLYKIRNDRSFQMPLVNTRPSLLSSILYNSPTYTKKLNDLLFTT